MANISRKEIKLYTLFSPLKPRLEHGKIILIDHGLYEYGYFNACFLTNMMSLMVYCLRLGFIPHIDLKDRKEGWTNWSSFFDQPFNTTIEGGCECICEVADGPFHPEFNTPYKYLDLRLWCKVYNHLVKLNKKTAEYVEDEYHQLFSSLPVEQGGLNKPKVLGVICRGTDYVKLQPKGHPIQPPVEMVVEKAKMLLENYQLSHVYLATEERAIYQQFEKAFQGRLLVNKRQYYDDAFNRNNLSHIYQVQFDRDDDIYLKGLEYLSSLQLLSRCDVLLGGNCGGACAALYMNNMKYRHVELFNMGLY